MGRSVVWLLPLPSSGAQQAMRVPLWHPAELVELPTGNNRLKEMASLVPYP